MNLPHLPKYLALAAVTGVAVIGAQIAITPASAKTVTGVAPAAVTAPHGATAHVAAVQTPAAHHPVTVPRGGASAEARAAIARYPQARIAASFYPPFETGDPSAYNCTLATDWLDVPLNTGQGPGRAGAGPAVKGIHATFPDLRITIEAIYVAGDTVTVRTTYRGTQAGPILGVPATGRKIEFRATDIHQIRHGQIVRTDHLEDLFGLYSQITAK